MPDGDVAQPVVTRTPAGDVQHALRHTRSRRNTGAPSGIEVELEREPARVYCDPQVHDDPDGLSAPEQRLDLAKSLGPEARQAIDESRTSSRRGHTGRHVVGSQFGYRRIEAISGAHAKDGIALRRSGRRFRPRRAPRRRSTFLAYLIRTMIAVGRQGDDTRGIGRQPGDDVGGQPVELGGGRRHAAA